MITNEIIENLNPCKDRYNNYLTYYKGKKHTYAQFLGLKHITQEDKLWVCFRLMDKNVLGKCSADVAELVLPIFETRFPLDKRPREAINAARGSDMVNANTIVNAAHQSGDDAANAAVGAYLRVDSAYYVAICAMGADADGAALAANQSNEKTIRHIVLQYLTEKRR
jgi:hypothetical protein